MRGLVPNVIIGVSLVFAASGCGSTAPVPVSSAIVDSSQSESNSVPSGRPESGTRNQPVAAVADPEIEPLISLLQAEFSEPIKEGRLLMIEDMTEVRPLYTPGSYEDFSDSLLRSAGADSPEDMIRDFLEKNRQPGAVWPELTRRLHAQVVTSEELKSIFKVEGDGWKSFYAKYPKAHGRIHVGRVGFNRDKTLALVYVGVQFHWVSGFGRLYILKKQGESWIETGRRIGPMWAS